MSEKWRVRTLDKRKMDVKKIQPQMIWCDPERSVPVDGSSGEERRTSNEIQDAKHQFQATKVYLMNDGEGHESAVVICPKHNLPIAVEIVRRTSPSRDDHFGRI